MTITKDHLIESAHTGLSATFHALVEDYGRRQGSLRISQRLDLIQGIEALESCLFLLGSGAVGPGVRALNRSIANLVDTGVPEALTQQLQATELELLSLV